MRPCSISHYGFLTGCFTNRGFYFTSWYAIISSNKNYVAKLLEQGGDCMSYKIVCDSCTDLSIELKNNPNFCTVPLMLHVDGRDFIDDETFNQADFLAAMKESSNCPKSSCPSPDAFMSHFDDADDIYVITLSSQLSGSYNSACLAKDLYLEDHSDKNIVIIDSKSASVGQTLIALKVDELAKQGKTFDEVVPEVLTFRDEMGTKFVLESLDNLRKNGRLSNLQAIIANALNIKPIMGATPEGTITKVDQARGMKKALSVMAKVISEEVSDTEKKILGIAHCNCRERAELVKEEILKLKRFKDVFIVDTAGVSSLYANDGGIVVSY